MAKRNANDRNAVALAKRKHKKGTWTASDGRVIHLKEKPSMSFIQAAISSVEFPERPTYVVKIGRREEEYPLDAEAIEQTLDPAEKAQLRSKWRTYLFELNEATQLQAKRGTGAAFYEGTIPDAELVLDDKAWQRKMRITGWKAPDDPEELWVFYLQTSLSDEEIADLSAEIIKQSGGVSEEEVEAAMDMFRDDLSSGPQEPGDVAVAETDQGGSAGR